MIKDTDIRIDLLDVLGVLYERKFQLLMILVLSLIISFSLTGFIFESKYLTSIKLFPILERKVEILEKNQFIEENFSNSLYLDNKNLDFDFDSRNLNRIFQENFMNEKLLIKTSEKFNYDVEYLFDNLELIDFQVIFRHGRPIKEIKLIEYHVKLVSDYSINVLFNELVDFLKKKRANLLTNLEVRDEEFRRIIMMDLTNSKRIAENLLSYAKELKIDDPIEITNYYYNLAPENKFFDILKGKYVLEKELIYINTKIKEVENMNSFNLLENYHLMQSVTKIVENKLFKLNESVDRIKYLNEKISYLNSGIDLTSIKFLKYDIRYTKFRSLSKIDKFAPSLFSFFVLIIYSLFFIIKDNQVKLRK